MILKSDCIADRLEGIETKTPDRTVSPADPLVIVPSPDLPELRKKGTASVDLHLGTWFSSLRQTRMTHLEVGKRHPESRLTKTHYVRFGSTYVLHPRNFVLAVTLEWLRLPADLSAYVIGKSSWGRRGLIIATATGVHPGFVGSLTLELSNVGELPVAIEPGMQICQLFFHKVKVGPGAQIARSQFACTRKPILGIIERDKLANELAAAHESIPQPPPPIAP